MQESFWWWQCNDRYLNIYNFPLPPPPYPYPPFSLSLINFMVSVGVKHHVYFTIMTIIIKICMFVFIIGRSCHKYNFCCNKSFIVTNMSFVVTKVCLLWQTFCEKIMFVATKWQIFNKSFVATNIILLRQKFCHDKSMLVVTKPLSQQNYVCCDKTFVTTKMILVAAPANGIFWSLLSIVLICFARPWLQVPAGAEQCGKQSWIVPLLWAWRRPRQAEGKGRRTLWLHCAQVVDDELMLNVLRCHLTY